MAPRGCSCRRSKAVGSNRKLYSRRKKVTTKGRRARHGGRNRLSTTSVRNRARRNRRQRSRRDSRYRRSSRSRSRSRSTSRSRSSSAVTMNKHEKEEEAFRALNAQLAVGRSCGPNALQRMVRHAVDYGVQHGVVQSTGSLYCARHLSSMKNAGSGQKMQNLVLCRCLMESRASRTSTNVLEPQPMQPTTPLWKTVRRPAGGVAEYARQLVSFLFSPLFRSESLHDTMSMSNPDVARRNVPARDLEREEDAVRLRRRLRLSGSALPDRRHKLQHAPADNTSPSRKARCTRSTTVAVVENGAPQSSQKAPPARSKRPQCSHKCPCRQDEERDGYERPRKSRRETVADGVQSPRPSRNSVDTDGAADWIHDPDLPPLPQVLSSHDVAPQVEARQSSSTQQEEQLDDATEYDDPNQIEEDGSNSTYDSLNISHLPSEPWD